MVKVAVRAETCDDCGNWLELMYIDRDPMAEPGGGQWPVNRPAESVVHGSKATPKDLPSIERLLLDLRCLEDPATLAWQLPALAEALR